MSAHASPAQIRSNLSHPIVDGDGHWLEYAPVFSEKMRKAGGDKGADGFLAALRSTTDALKLTPGGARPPRRRAAQFLEPPGREHARPRDGDDAEDALRPARRDRPRFRDRLSDRRAAPAAHQGRRDPPRRDPRLQHRLGRVFQRPRRPADPGRDHPDAPPRGGDRRTRIRHQAARLEGRHVRQRHVAPVARADRQRHRALRRAGDRQPV